LFVIDYVDFISVYKPCLVYYCSWMWYAFVREVSSKFVREVSSKMVLSI
jgi:(2Fe-2S) ferredoxin